MADNEIYSYRAKRNYKALVKDLEVNRVLPSLMSDGVFKEFDELEEIKCENTRRKRAEKLLQMLDERGPYAWVSLVGALKDSSQSHLADILNVPVLGEREALQGNVINPLTQNFHGLTIGGLPPRPPGVFRHPVPEENLEVMPSNAFVKPTNRNLLPPNVHPDSDGVYKMKSNPRGIALIINNHSFTEDTSREKMGNRPGSEVDVKNLEKLFGPTGLNFVVNTQENLTADEIKRCIEQTAKLQEHCGYDCFVMFLMSHGDSGVLYGIDNLEFDLRKIGEVFTSTRCIPLMKKPKLFFIQSCRGKNSEIGMTVKDSPESDATPQQKPETSEIQFDFGPKTTHPDCADMLFAYASVEGYAAHRHEQKGSWFISSLVEVFRENASHMDLLSMLTIVNRKVSERGSIGKKQVPEPKHTLIRSVYFWPGMVFEEPNQRG